jgi:hypothetical protein
MDDNDHLQRSYQYIRRCFFPRWDRQRCWTVSAIPDLPSDGRCDTKARRIYVRACRRIDIDHLHLLLIHEICHAFHPNHGEKWCRRLQKAAETARRLGRSRLAALLDHECTEYHTDRMATAPEVYQRIRDTVHRFPHVPYGDLIRYLAWEEGLYQAEFEKKYALCRRKFEAAKTGIPKAG